jgi:glycosyltransferase involved in cell wall biosynthesis
VEVPFVNLLHAIHDFLPRHLAGSEIYAFNLCRELGHRHEVRVLCAEYDAGRPQGSIVWRSHEGVPVVEVVNNWHVKTFADGYRSRALGSRLEQVLDDVRPDVLHIHNLLNLTMALPELARARGIPSVATLHDFTLVCPSGGQRVHLAEEHLCDEIDVHRCSRCFVQSPFYSQMVAGIKSAPTSPNGARSASRMSLAGLVNRLQGGGVSRLRPSPRDIERRLRAVARVYDSVDLFVAPSHALAEEYIRLGLPAGKLQVSDYGFAPLRRPPQRPTVPTDGPLRIGFVGTLVWHKGVHVLVDAARRLEPGRFEILLFGDPEVFPSYVASLRSMAEGLPVRFMGRFEQSVTSDVYEAMDVLVVPSIWLENSPLVIHEAFMAGVPVVGARRGGIPGLVIDGHNGLTYNAFSPDALAAALNRLIADRDLVRELGSHAPPVKTIEEEAREWEAIYTRVVQRSRVGGRKVRR